MKTGMQRRNELRRRRLEAEAAAASKARRVTLVKAFTLTMLAVLLTVSGLALAITSGDGRSGSNQSVVEVERLLRDVPQEGTILGNPKAKVTVVEFGDLQCSHCKQFAESVIPALVEGPVESGDVNLEFRNLPIFEGDDSVNAARASLAASLQGRYWQFIETFYAQQGIAGTDYVTDEFLRSIAEKAGVEDLDKWEFDRNDPRWDRDLTDTETLAKELGVSTTPRIAIRDKDGILTPLKEGASLEEIEIAISETLQ